MSKFSEIYSLVKLEAEALRKHATQEEKDKLNIDDVSPGDIQKCFYGLMTGGCFSLRANFLIVSCAKPFSRWITRYKRSYVQTFRYNRYSGNRMYFTPLEYYIYQAYTQNQRGSIANLIAYIKGESDTLELGKISISGL